MNSKTFPTFWCNIPTSRYLRGNVPILISRYSTRPPQDREGKKKYLKVPSKPLQWKDVTLMVQRCVDLVRGNARVWHNRLVTQQSSSGETGFILRKYEKLIGLTEVQQSQAKVLQSEKMLLETLQERRETAGKIMDVQRRIKVGTTPRTLSDHSLIHWIELSYNFWPRRLACAMRACVRHA